MSQASDWLDLDRAKDELQVSKAIGDYDLELIASIEGAVSAIETALDFPLVDRPIIWAGLPVPAPGAPLVLPPTPHLQSITKVEWRTDADSPYAPANTLALGASPVLENATGARGGLWRYWPDADWPVGAQSLRVTGMQGADAYDPALAVIRTAIILRLREAWEGVAVLEKKAAWERLIEGHKWNPATGV